MLEFVCYTDTPDCDFHSDIRIQTLPGQFNIHGWWWKLYILGYLEHQGPNIYMDLDMLVTGDLRPYAPQGQGLWGLWNVHHLNSSILGWRDRLPDTWRRFWMRRHWHLGRGGVWGDQDVINECVAQGDFEQHWYPQELTAWLDVKTKRLARDLNPDVRAIVCKGPRNPHENTEHPLVQQYWKLL